MTRRKSRAESVKLPGKNNRGKRETEMIRTLTIHNIALIEHITVHFHKGLTVLSGETGAGKSIIVDAVALILGGRADRDLIRTG